ncbi:MAG: phosphoribosylamine--glycine ligase [Planctomycetaceae bacterium]|nr:phosphoribosylamine--glycine ligase [Planctomycetaceae bacterium]
MKVLVVGSGGREHALVWKILQSPRVTEVYCAPGNAGTALLAQNVNILVDDIGRLVAFARKMEIGLTVVGPEAPLCDGIVDAFIAAKLRVFGPTKRAAELEGSKGFSKELMRQAGVPTADFRVFDAEEPALNWLEERNDAPLVVKVDGLAAGKGVLVCSGRDEAVQAVKSIFRDRTFGEAGKKIVIEECLVGQEASILALVDGTTIIPLEASQDHKAAGDGDTGPNTGGMGAYSPTPVISPETLDLVLDKVLIPTVHAMRRMKRTFRGVLYAGIMLTSQGPKVLEFNVRLGDPEAQAVLMRLRSDIVPLLEAVADGQLAKLIRESGESALDWDPRPAVCVVMASEGYPEEYKKGHPIRGLEAAARLPDTQVFHAGTALQGGEVVTAGGRVLGVTALGDSISDAKLRAYQAVKLIRWNGAWCRKDISDKARQLAEG